MNIVLNMVAQVKSSLLTKQSSSSQVLDDSTDKVTRELVDQKVLEWQDRGVNVTCVRRTNRHGYKAGALKDVSDPCGHGSFMK